MICSRNSGGYGGLDLGIVDSFLRRDGVSTERGQLNLVHGAEFNLGLLMRKRQGAGTPRRQKGPISPRTALARGRFGGLGTILSAFRRSSPLLTLRKSLSRSCYLHPAAA